MLIKLKFQIDKPSEGKRLDKFIFENVGALSRMYLADQIKNELCFINGKTGQGGDKLQAGNVVEIEIDDAVRTAMTPEDLPLEVVYEDAEIIVVNKPAGMLVHPTKNVKTGTLSNVLSFHLNFSPQNTQRNTEKDYAENPKSVIQNPKLIRPVLVHRLDKQTSGLMVVAKTARAGRILSTNFERKLIGKIYLAIVEGVVLANEGIISAPIGRVEEKPHWRVLPEGKKAETHFRTLERRTATTLLELEPVTGRTNQLRIHCAEIGHPIVGDEWYGAKQSARLHLHAAKLSFYHPNGGWLTFESQLPPDFITK